MSTPTDDITEEDRELALLEGQRLSELAHLEFSDGSIRSAENYSQQALAIFLRSLSALTALRLGIFAMWPL